MRRGAKQLKGPAPQAGPAVLGGIPPGYGEMHGLYEPVLSFLDAHQIAPRIEETAKNRAPNVSMAAGDLP